MKGLVYFILFFLMPFALSAQVQKLQLNKGNEAYRDSVYGQAIEKYSSALEADGDLVTARFNRANAMVRMSAKMAAEAAKLEDDSLRTIAIQEAMEINKKAASDFESIAKLAEDDSDRNKARFNQGNAHLLGGEIDKSIEAYKDALRARPDDDQARYNLAYAQSLRQKQQEQQQDQQEDGEQSKDEQQDQQQSDQKDQNQQDQQQQQQQPDQITQEEAQQLLEAMMQREKELQEEVNKRKRKPQLIKIEKDW